MLAGRIDFVFGVAASTFVHVRNGDLKVYAVMAKTRWAAAPDIPTTIDETGVPGLYASYWHGLWVPKETPKEPITRLNSAVQAALADATVQQRLADQGYDVLPREQQTPEALAAQQKVGGIVLNSAVGGINPDAVNWMWRMQGGYGRVVWFPTFDADNHVKHFKDAPEGIKVLNADGTVLPAVREVLKICAEQKLVVHTGHLSPSEALAVIAAGRDIGVDHMVVTHAQFEVVNMSFEEMKKAASMGAKLELCAMGTLMGPEAHLAWMRHWRRVKVEETAAAVKEVGPQNFILATASARPAIRVQPTASNGSIPKMIYCDISASMKTGRAGRV
jgi:hypothetical protein